MAILQTENVSKIYTIAEREIAVLEDITFEIEEGTFVVISGSSGSGKTTLLSILSGLDKPSSGRILLADKDITGLNEDQLAEIRNRTTGFVFQAFHLVPSLNAIENVMFPAELCGDLQAEEKAEELLRKVGVWERRNSFPSQLSGGEKQRVALCRALINKPRIVFADEPTGNLDSRNSDEIVKLLLDMQREYNTTLVMATHSPEITAMAQKTISLVDGKISN